MKRGFTLIELLVVVLIIGILSAIAIPQYQKAVMKSRFSELQTVVRSLKEVRDVSYLANGFYPMDFDELDISLGGVKSTSGVVMTVGGKRYVLYGEGELGFVSGELPGKLAFVMYQEKSTGPWRPANALCYAVVGNAAADEVCRSMGTLIIADSGCTVGQGGNCNIYGLW